MTYTIKRSDDEINDVMNRAAEGMEGGGRWPGMSFEEGVHQALNWVTGGTDENPMSEN